MRDGNSKKSKKFSWPKTLVKKWFNIKNKAEDIHADDVICVDEEWMSNLPEKEACTIKKSKTERSNRRNFDRVIGSKNEFDASQITDVHNYRMFVATWNVAGKSPPNHLNLEEWLHTSPPADIYVLGFQEIVPLNAGNVLGTEDNGPAKKWLALIRETLNSLPGNSTTCPTPISDPIIESDNDFEGQNPNTDREKGSSSSFFNCPSFRSLSRSLRMSENEVSMETRTQIQPRLDRRFSICDRVIYGNRPSNYYHYCYDHDNVRWENSSDDENGQDESPYMHNSPISDGDFVHVSDKVRHRKYCLVASKQMVGIFLTVWIKSDLRYALSNLKVSCVGRGLMGYLGNKGSISISMSLHRTSFCFVCSHLTSGEKDGDELRRNSDVMEILRKTRFPRVHGTGDERSPQTILDHDQIIWLGDLNYRIALSYQFTKALVEMRNWRALLENDQLRTEQRHGRVFVGWNEGRIYFPPTYKYRCNSDRYAGENIRRKEKRRTPAWCDRILWYGRGLHQLSYVCGESRFSDHRPVYSVFLAEVEVINRSRFKKSTSYSSSRIEVEELLPYSHAYNQQI